jgi:hypothetical protein
MAECTICLQASDEGAHELPCGHSFHTGCILHWFRVGHRECPNCRSEETEACLARKTPAQRIAMLRRKRTLPLVVRTQLRRHDAARDAARQASVQLRAFRTTHKQVIQEWNRLRNLHLRQKFVFLRAQRLIASLSGDAPFYGQ